MARVALVTGGTRGIGAGIAKRLQKEGYKVAVCDVVDEQIAKFKEETGIPGYNINVADYDAVADGVKKIEGRGRADRHSGQQRRHHPGRRASSR